MKIIREPSVYLVGRQDIDEAELNRFLADHDVSWETDSEIGGETLAEVAGRICYMSFSRPRPGGNAGYLSHILEVGHGCYDAETDVLTSSGWKSWDSVSKSDKFATINPETRAIEYQSAKRLIRYTHVGQMYRVESQQVDLLVTPNHRMLACQTTTREGRKKETFSLIEASDLGGKSHAYLKVGEWAGGWWNECPGRDVFALLGFTIGDGHMSGPGSETIRFRLRRERKISWLMSLCGRLQSLGFSLENNSNDDRYTVRLPATKMIRHLFGGIYDDDGEKQIPHAESVLTGASRSGLDGLFEGLMQSDGHCGRTGDSFDTTSPHLPGQFQQLCLHIGLAANVCYTYGPDQRSGSFGTKPLTRLSVIRRCHHPEVNKWSGADGSTRWIDGWQGEVFCAEVPNGTLYVRRNGIPVWSGNSVLEHAVWNLVFTGVSRTLTHELVRHRAGFGFSQLSQRYVDESVAEYVEPDVIANNPEAHKRWVNTVGVAHEGYLELVAILAEVFKDEPDKTLRRKLARQAARSVLPNATETKIFVTANARALRHFIELRCSRHAETEIRKLAGAVLRVMKTEAPNLFSDYEEVPLDDGTFEATTPHRKV